MSHGHGHRLKWPPYYQVKNNKELNFNRFFLDFYRASEEPAAALAQALPLRGQQLHREHVTKRR